MAQGLTGLGQSAALDGAFEGRIERSSNTVLLLSRYKGILAEVNGDVQVIPSAGLSVTIGAGGSDTINSSGADSAAKTAVSTLYYVYVSSGRASPNPNAIRLSTTAPSLYNGRKYLATSGNGAEWRFAGWVRTDASGNLIDSDTQRFVVNNYNRQPKGMHTCPGYSDGNTRTTYTTTSTTFTAANAGTGSKLELISNGEDAVDYSFSLAPYGGGGAAAAQGGVGEDSATAGVYIAMKIAPTLTAELPMHGRRSTVMSEGYRHLNLLITSCSGGSTSNWTADQPREGNGTDVRVGYLMASVMV